MRRLLFLALLLLLLTCPARADQSAPVSQAGPTGVAHFLSLSPAERQWLAAHSLVRVGILANSPPVAFAGANGQPQGIIMDYLEIARRELGLEFQVTTYPKLNTIWTEMGAGRLDVALAAVDSPEREGLVLRTKPFLTIPLVVMTRANDVHLHQLSELHGKTLIVPRDQVVQYWLERDYPSINLVAGDYESGLWAVSEGRVDGLVAGLVNLVWITRELGIDNLKVAFATEYNYQLNLAVRRDLPVLAGMLDRVLAGVPEVEQNAIYRRWVPMHMDGAQWQSILEAAGMAVMIVGSILAFILLWNRRLAGEVARRRQAEEVLTSTKRLFETVFNSQMDAIIALDASNPPLIMECNAAAEHMFGYLRSEMLGRSTAFLHVDEQHLQRLRDGLFPAASTQGFYTTTDFEMIRQNGEIFPCDLSIAQLTGDDGRHLGWVSVISDASLRKQAREERQRLFDLSLVMLCVTGVDGYFREVNPAWSAILGWSPEELKARPSLEIVHPEDRAETAANLARMAQGQAVIGYENRMRCKDGDWRWLLWNSVPVPSTGLIYCAALDVTERKRLEADLVRLATIDSLTNICNRHHFLERAEQEIQRVRRYGRAGMALLMMDLDHFKEINDRHGHEAGDKVLSEMAARVLDMLRESDVMGRLGGEEFAVLLVETGNGEAVQVAERLRATLAQSPVLAAGRAIGYTLSIGVASLSPADQGVEDLLRRADQALYQAKRLGRNRVESA